VLLALPALPSPQRLAVRCVNALLTREAWARALLARHAGKTARLVWARLEMSLTVLADGQVELAHEQAEPAVVLTVDTQGLACPRPGVGSDVFADMTHISGDAAFAQTIAQLARDLRPDWQDALAERVGDVAAVRLTQGARALFAGVRVSGQRLLTNVAEYLSEESALLLARPVFMELCDSLTETYSALDALDARLARLTHHLHTRMPDAPALRDQSGTPS